MRFAFLGHGEPGAAALRALVGAGPRPEIVVVGHPPLRPNALNDASDGLGLPATDVDVGDIESLAAALDRCAVDAVIVTGWPRRIRPELLQTPGVSWINCHPSWLPLWRGHDPVGWPLLGGEHRLGVTVHEMDEHFDHGRRLARRSVELPADVSRRHAYDLLCTHIGELAAEVLHRDLEPDPAALTNDAGDGTSGPPSGVLPLLDPSILHRRAARRAIRAFSPVPGVGVIGVDGLVALPDEADGLAGESIVVEFVDGPLTVILRPFGSDLPTY